MFKEKKLVKNSPIVDTGGCDTQIRDKCPMVFGLSLNKL